MSENEDFHLYFLPRFIDAQRAFHDGDPEPNMALWAVAAPVTLFAARGLIDSSTESVTRTFQNVAATFSDVGTFEWQPLAEGVNGDFAYTVAVERYTNSRDGGPLEQTELRATHVYRREDGKWRAVHRHADRRPPDRGDGFNAAIEAVRDALRQYVKGDPEPALAFFSDRDDVTLANPLDPPRRGPTGVREGARRVADNFRAGGPLRFADVTSSFTEISRWASADLGYVLQIERHEGRAAGSGEPLISELRATLVFRRENGVWRIAHRHADPITGPRSSDTLIQS
jgi:ketosteroid isomerase-like protein